MRRRYLVRSCKPDPLRLTGPGLRRGPSRAGQAVERNVGPRRFAICRVQVLCLGLGHTRGHGRTAGPLGDAEHTGRGSDEPKRNRLGIRGDESKCRHSLARAFPRDILRRPGRGAPLSGVVGRGVVSQARVCLGQRRSGRPVLAAASRVAFGQPGSVATSIRAVGGGVAARLVALQIGQYIPGLGGPRSGEHLGGVRTLVLIHQLNPRRDYLLYKT